ncbi:MAG TPA: TrbC/VirB2 family protein [Steroidobacteraceae bacterium]
MKLKFCIDAGSSCELERRKQWLLAAAWMVLLLAFSSLTPELAFAGSPFSTGASAANTNILAILTPIAVIAVMAIGAAAWFNKISWGWAAAGIVGICLVFGAQQIVTWVRGMFGV